MRSPFFIRSSLACVFAFVSVRGGGVSADPPRSIRVATFNVSLYGRHAGDVADRLASGDDAQAKKIASVIQSVRPDILLVNELDFDDQQRSVAGLREMLGRGDEPIEFAYHYAPPSNTGIDSEMDLDGDGVLGGPADAFGFGIYPGQYALAVLSRFPIKDASVRRFDKFLWADLPDAVPPMLPDGSAFYDQATWSKLRLSSKSHIDVPIQIEDRVLHLLASHPTPPVFDGPEDRNGLRNKDEILFWQHYIDGTLSLEETPIGNTPIADNVGDAGNDQSKPTLALEKNGSFVIAGDLNSDPDRGDSIRSGISRLLDHRRINDVRPRHAGGDTTALFGERQIRVDYVLPSIDLRIQQSGVYWPTTGPQAEAVTASDHRLVWIDIAVDSIGGDSIGGTEP